MIHYHGTPISGGKDNALKFLNGRHALISYAHKDHTPQVLESCQSFCLDNGAFSTWKSGRPFDLDGCLSWYEDISRHPGFDFALMPDVIGGSEEENDALLRDFPTQVRGVPVWHTNESIDRFFRLAADYDYIALGSSNTSNPGSFVWWEDIIRLMDAVCDEDGRPPVKLHGLRMLSPKVFPLLPLKSADSVNAAINSGRCLKGIYPSVERWQGSERIAYRIEAVQSAPVWDRELVGL